ncbi:MAG: PAS domain-containing protein [Granulosicoccus sp.]
MDQALPIRTLLIHDVHYNTGYLQKLASTSNRKITLTTTTWMGEEHAYPIESVDVVLLDLHAVIGQSVDPDLLGDAMFARVPTVLVGDSSIGECALQGMRAGAMDWLVHGHMKTRPLYNVLEFAMRAYSRQRDLVMSHARYRDVVEDQSEFICRFLPDFTITFANKPYTRYVSKTSNTIEGTSLLDITPIHEREGFRKKIFSLTPQFPVTSYDRSVVIDGDIYWQQWSDKAFFDSNGVMIEVQSIGKDITERKSAEQHALDSNARFQTLFKHSPVMMCELGRDGTIVSINDRCVELLGYAPTEILGQNGYRYMDSLSRRNLADSVQKLRNDGWISGLHCNLVTAKKDHIPVNFSATANVDNEKNITGCLVVLVENHSALQHAVSTENND